MSDGRAVVSCVVWRLVDGKPGHDNQGRGLVAALADRVALEEHVLPVEPWHKVFRWWLTGRYPPGRYLPAPDLIVGAGHATHLSMLAARRACGGRAVVLMKPSLPCAWFDLCVVPEHDRVSPAANLITTRGVLNAVRAGGEHADDVGLIVIGGPSRHSQWHDDDLLGQIDELTGRRPKRQWWLTSSRRTPAELVQRLQRQTQVHCVPCDETSPDWLPARMSEAGEVWVTEDSISMIYESLSAGARVGLLGVGRTGRNRITQAVDKLVSDGWVAAPRQWTLAAGPEHTLNEAARCADWITRQWLSAS